MSESTAVFTTRYLVPLECSACEKQVSESILLLPGVEHVATDRTEQVVTVRGVVPPSAVIEAIEGTGRSAILRGSGEPGSSAVCVLEKDLSAGEDRVRGLARMIQTGSGSVFVDLTLQDVAPGDYPTSIRQTGDLSHGFASVGAIWESNLRDNSIERSGMLGSVRVGLDRRGSAFLQARCQIWEIIGRAMVVSSSGRDEKEALFGVIARSAGLWENEKKVITPGSVERLWPWLTCLQVCSCSGKTIWEERQEQKERGVG